MAGVAEDAANQELELLLILSLLAQVLALEDDVGVQRQVLLFLTLQVHVGVLYLQNVQVEFVKEHLEGFSALQLVNVLQESPEGT